MRPHDLVIEAFIDELDRLEKAAGVGGLLAAGALGALALPVGKTVVQAKMMSGAQDFGDMSRPQFQRRFGQHLAPQTLGESVGMAGLGLWNMTGPLRAAGGRAASSAYGTAKDMYSKPGYVRSNLGG